MIGWLEDCFATHNHLGISNRFVGVMPRGSFIYWIFWDFNRISLPSAQNIFHESQKNHFVYCTQTSQTDFSQIRKQQIHYPIYDKHLQPRARRLLWVWLGRNRWTGSKLGLDGWPSCFSDLNDPTWKIREIIWNDRKSGNLLKMTRRGWYHVIMMLWFTENQDGGVWAERPHPTIPLLTALW